MESFSQHGQDRYVYERFFKDRGEAGVFVDIGAYDGVTFSNSLFFEKHLGWRGICIEPLPETFKKLKESRKAICLNHAVSDFTGTGKFADVDLGKFEKMYSGLSAYYHQNHNETIKKYASQVRIIDVEIKPLSAVLDEHGFRQIDYLSIDTEGAEMPVLRGANLGVHDVRVLSVENNYQDPEIGRFLAGFGYRRVHVFARFDELYCKADAIESKLAGF
jgi:FkbM family methyltransferase